MNPFGTSIPQTGKNIPQPQMNIPQPTITPQELMAMQKMLYNSGAGNPYDQDFMAMTSGINKLNFQC